MATYTAGSVGVLVTPNLSGFQKDLKKQLTGSGLEAAGRSLADDIVKPLKADTSAGAKAAKDGIDQEIGKKAPTAEIDQEEYEKKGDGAGKGFTKLFRAGALAGIAAAGAAIGASFAAAFTKGVEQNANAGQLQAALGIDKKSADALAQDASGMYATGVGSDSTSNSEAITIAAQILPDVDSSAVATQALTLEQAFGYSVEESITAVDQMIKNGLVSNWQEGFDLITSATQQGLNRNGDLLDTMTEYGPQFRQMGLTGAEALGLISQGLEGGARNTDLVADALKEFTIRAQDGSDTTRDALNALGLDADQVMSDMAAGGDRGKRAFDQVTTALAGIEDPLTRNNLAVALFGTQAEDLGPALANMDLGTAGDQFTDVAGSTEEATQALIDSQSPIETFQRGMSGLAAELGTLFAPAIGQVNGALQDFFGYLIENLVPGLETFGNWIKDNSPWLISLGVTIGAVAIASWIASGGLAALGASLVAVGLGIKGVFLAIAAGIRSIPVIGQIILVIGLLISALIWFFTQTELGKQIWENVWNAIKVAAGAVADWFVNTVWPLLQTAWQGIAAGALWLYHNAILPAWNGIKWAIGVVVDWILYTAVPWLQSAWTAISGAVTWLYQSVILPVWDAIRIAIAVAVGIIMSVIDGLVWIWRNVMAPVLTWLYQNVVLPVWNAIRAAISAVVNWFRDTAWPILSSVINWIRTKFEQFKLGLQIIWGFIKNNVINPVVSWFQNTVWPILSMVINWIRAKFENFKLGLQIIWGFIKNNIINPVIAWFRDIAWPMISNVIERIKSGFQGMKDRLKSIWDGVRNNVINPVVHWFENDVLGRINKFVDKVKESFTKMKDGIGEAFNKVKEVVRTPVEWLIDTIVNDSIIDNINSVLTTFGMEDKHIGRVSLPKGFATGGYTGPGSKYQPAGVVHADEFVIRKESQNSLRRAAPGFLDSLNRYGAKALEGSGYGYAGGGWVKPFDGNFSINSQFRTSHRPNHDGVDYPTPSGTPILAVTAGTIKSARRTLGAAGKKIELNTALTGIVAGYHHLSEMLVDAGDQVKAGQLLGYTGNTGRSSGPHLHFSIRKDGKYVDPNPYLAGTGAAGTGEGGGLFNPFSGLWDKLKDQISEKVGDSVFGQVLTGFPKFVIDKGIEWARDSLTFWDGNHDPEGGAEQWRDLAKSALKREGQYSKANLDSMIRRINQESGGNPRAINDWDSNAAMGDPSKGLMQVIGTTFAGYRDKSLVNDVYDPLANMIASIRYTLATYGSLRAGWDRKGGYAEGGLVTPELHDSGGILKPGLNLISNKTKKPEAILTDRQFADFHKIAQNARGGDGVILNQYINSADATADRIASSVTWELRRQKITGRR